MKIISTILPSDTPTCGEISCSFIWDGQPTELSIFCDHMLEREQDVKAAIIWAESRISKLQEAISLQQLRLWCLSMIRQELPWFITERLLETDHEGTTLITSKPEKMVELLVPTIEIHYHSTTNKAILTGHLSCPSLDHNSRINTDLNHWLGNHQYRFTIADENTLIEFRADG